MKIAIFPGSFDPFTCGHADIVRRALPLFDKIVIGIGKNSSKQCTFSIEQRLSFIYSAFENESKVEAVVYEGLTVDFANEQHAQYILRGVRNTTDFEYEKSIAQINKELSGIETIILYTDPKLAHISSTLVRDLYINGQDITQFLA